MNSDDNQQGFAVSVDGEPWMQVASLQQTGADDKAFALDPEDGTVRFGDGEHGRRPASGAAITVSYRQGGGSAGDVTISARFRWPPTSTQFRTVLGENGVSIRKVEIAAVEYSGEKRPTYFAGQLLTADDLRDEQAYLLRKLRRHNRSLHGWGVVSGLEVSRGSAGASVVIAPGLALDVEGHEILVTSSVELEIGERPSPQYVLIEYIERETDPAMPIPGEDSPSPTRIEDGVSFGLAETDSGSLAIGRLVRDTSGWMVDHNFHPRRPR